MFSRHNPLDDRLSVIGIMRADGNDRTRLGSLMPRYYFHYRCDFMDLDDEEGVRLRDDEAASEQALRGARDILAAEVCEGRLALDHLNVVERDGGVPVLTLSLGEAVGVPRTVSIR